MAASRHGQLHIYQHGDLALHGELYQPAVAANGRAVLVVHEADGIGGNVRRHCEKLAALGYVAMAADMHGEGKPLEGDAMQQALERFRQQPDLVRGRVAAGWDALLEVTGIDAANSAAIGFCFGGYAALELARSGSPVAAVASFHGLLATAKVAQPGEIHPRIAVFTGATDPLVPIEDVIAFQKEMSAAGADWQMTSYGKALHGAVSLRRTRLHRMQFDF